MDSLEGFSTSWVRPDVDWQGESGRDALKARGEESRLPIVVTSELTFPGRNRAQVDIAFFNSVGGDVVLDRTYEFRYRSMPALMAQIEYEMTHDLKRQFSEVGRVIRARDNEVYFDLGSIVGVEVGDVYRVYQRGDRLTSSAGDNYGYLNEYTDVVEVKAVTGSFAIADIIFGHRSIEDNQWLSAVPGEASDYAGYVLAKLEDEVAVSLGRMVGVQVGDEFAIHKDLEQITEQDAFQVEVSRVRITQVHDDYARGVILRNDNYELAKGLVEAGDAVSEVEPSRTVQLNLSSRWMGLTEDNPTTVYTLGLRFESQQSQNLLFRITGGYWDTTYASVGLMLAANQSESFFYGVDAVWTGETLDTFGSNLFVSMNAPLPFPSIFRLNSEIGYMVSGDEDHSGLNISVGITALTPGS